MELYCGEGWVFFHTELCQLDVHALLFRVLKMDLSASQEVRHKFGSFDEKIGRFKINRRGFTTLWSVETPVFHSGLASVDVWTWLNCASQFSC